MTQGAKKLIEEFEVLPERDRQKSSRNSLVALRQAPHDLPNDEDLLAAADRLFIDLDRRE